MSLEEVDPDDGPAAVGDEDRDPPAMPLHYLSHEIKA